MWLEIKRLFGGQKADSTVSEREARGRLQALRENELSVGAHMRRGALIAKVPGLTAGGAPVGASTVTPPGTGNARQAPTVVGMQRADPSEDFAMSMAVGAGSGSAALGYAVGRSQAGAFVGSSLHHNGSDAPHSSLKSDDPAGSVRKDQ